MGWFSIFQSEFKYFSNSILFLLIRLFRIRPVFLSGFWSPLLKFNNTFFCHFGWSALWLSQTVLVFKLAHNVLRVGDVALCCACGKAILLTRCYGLFLKSNAFFIKSEFGQPDESITLALKSGNSTPGIFIFTWVNLLFSVLIS